MNNCRDTNLFDFHPEHVHCLGDQLWFSYTVKLLIAPIDTVPCRQGRLQNLAGFNVNLPKKRGLEFGGGAGPN